MHWEEIGGRWAAMRAARRGNGGAGGGGLTMATAERRAESGRQSTAPRGTPGCGRDGEGGGRGALWDTAPRVGAAIL